MKKSRIQEITREFDAVERGEISPARVSEVTILPGGAMRRVELYPETHRRKQARAWKAKTEAAKVRHELDLTQEDFATMLGVSFATLRKWEGGTGEPSGAAKMLLGGGEAVSGGG
ncbi:MAG: helix-turn-helix domain-containing protein [Verrucomicrobiota bacterium]